MMDLFENLDKEHIWSYDDQVEEFGHFKDFLDWYFQDAPDTWPHMWLKWADTDENDIFNKWEGTNYPTV